MPFAGSFCSEQSMRQLFGAGGLAVFCNIGAFLLFLAICYIATHFIISFMPQTGSFHNFFMALLITFGLALLGRIAFSDAYSWLMLAFFAAGYAMHLLVDGEKKNR